MPLLLRLQKNYRGKVMENGKKSLYVVLGLTEDREFVGKKILFAIL